MEKNIMEPSSIQKKKNQKILSQKPQAASLINQPLPARNFKSSEQKTEGNIDSDPNNRTKKSLIRSGANLELEAIHERIQLK
jgi:hypothetical protein